MSRHHHTGECKACHGKGIAETPIVDEDGEPDIDEDDCEECNGDGELGWPWDPVDPDCYDLPDLVCGDCGAQGVELTDYANDDFEILLCFKCAQKEHDRLCGCDDPLWKRPDQGVLL